jgi:uncharacterized protein YfaS (alpha-2-macroglobulin family)
MNRSVKSDAELAKLRGRLDWYGSIDDRMPEFQSDDAKPNEHITSDLKAYRLYALCLTPDSRTIKDPPRYLYFNQDQLFGPYKDQAASAKLSLQALSWIYLAAKEAGGQKEVEDSLCGQILKRSSEQQHCSRAEQLLLHNSQIKKDAVLLQALAECGAKPSIMMPILKRITNRLAKGESTSDSDIAFASVALAKVVPAPIGEQLLAATEKKPLTPSLSQVAPTWNIDQGICVRRHYEAADSASKVWQTADGAWHATRGSAIRCSVDFVPERFANNVVLADYFPAGLATNKYELGEAFYHMATANNGEWDYNHRWMQMTKVDLNCVKAFGTNLQPTEYTFAYTLHAVSPGNYLAPGAIVKCPFNTSIIGTSACDRFIVE